MVLGAGESVGPDGELHPSVSLEVCVGDVDDGDDGLRCCGW